MLHSFLIVFLGVAAAQASPGPNMFAVIETALGRGRRPALLVVAGIASGTLVWAALAALGLGAVFAAVPALLTALEGLAPTEEILLDVEREGRRLTYALYLTRA